GAHALARPAGFQDAVDRQRLAAPLEVLRDQAAEHAAQGALAGEVDGLAAFHPEPAVVLADLDARPRGSAERARELGHEARFGRAVTHGGLTARESGERARDVVVTRAGERFVRRGAVAEQRARRTDVSPRSLALPI